MASIIEHIKRIWSTYDTLRVTFFGFGIIICYLYFGIQQEKIMRACYTGEVVDGSCNGERFAYEMSLVLVYCTWYAIFARCLIFINDKYTFLHHAEKDETLPQWYIVTAFCYISAMVCSNMSLRHINYPTQVITKCSKPIPVMILGAILAGKRYTIQKYVFVFLVVFGVILFVMKRGNEKSSNENTYLGLGLIAMSLLSDGVLGGIEDRIRKATRPTALNFMFSINLFSSVILIVVVFVSHEIFEFYDFIHRFPHLIIEMVFAACVGSIGQIFIFMMLSNFGALPTSIATTSRKFFNVLISVVFFGNSLVARQWWATAIVFAALFADALFGRKEFCKKRKGGEGDDVEKGEGDNEVEMKMLNEKSAEQNGSKVDKLLEKKGDKVDV